MISKSPEQTKKIAKDFLKTLKNNVIFLIGDLGSGKTQFAKGVAEGLGIKENVTSPTFVLIREYYLENPAGSSRHLDKMSGLLRMTGVKKYNFSRLIHADLYRLKAIDEFTKNQLKEYVTDKSNLVLIEWPEKIAGFFNKYQTVKFKHIGEKEREIKIGK
jgi:tRNA threonylcarbamoyladenosine biosynthesis protein TsaE